MSIVDSLTAVIMSGLRTEQGILWKKLEEIDGSKVHVDKLKVRML